MLSRDLRREREYKLVQLLEKNIADESEARKKKVRGNETQSNKS